MHDPSTVAFEIPYPWKKYGKAGRNDWERNYRESFITIWHEDPESDGSDDSCGWSYPKVPKEAKWLKDLWGDLKSLKPDKLREQHAREGAPMWWLLWLHRTSFWHRRKGLSVGEQQRWLFGNSYSGNRADDYYEKDPERLAWIFARCYLQLIRPWYRHPRWHFWHWRLQVHPYQLLRRFLLSRCCKCGGRFKYGESPVTDQWDNPKPKFLQGETGLYHGDCGHHGAGPAVAQAK